MKWRGAKISGDAGIEGLIATDSVWAQRRCEFVRAPYDHDTTEPVKQARGKLRDAKWWALLEGRGEER